MKRGSDFYKNLLTKSALLLERHPSHPGGSADARASARQIRLAIKKDLPLAVLKIISNAAGQELQLCDLRQRYLPSHGAQAVTRTKRPASRD